jgi:very-short-patch-repair endonuclease
VELRLNIELDGEVHQSFSQDAHDHIRTVFLNKNGISVLRYKNEVVYQNAEVIVEDIKRIKEGNIKDVLGYFYPKQMVKPTD